MEVEVAHRGHLPADCTTTQIKYHEEHDGSVKPSHIELVAAPLYGDAVPLGLAEMCKMLRASQCRMNNTCGYHVHIDASDFSAVQLRRMWVLWWCLQEQIFGTVVAQSRSTNTFCPALRATPEGMHALLHLSAGECKNWFHKRLYGVDIDPSAPLITRKQALQSLARAKAHKYENDARRMAVNFHSWMMRGTLEFRCKEGTLDPADFVLWPQFCLYLVHLASTITDSVLMEWVDKPPALIALPALPAPLAKWVEMRVAQPAPEPAPYNGGM